MDRVEVLGLFDRQMRRGARAESVGGRIEWFGGVVRQSGAAGGDWACVLWSGLDEGSVDAAIAEQLRWLASAAGAGCEFEWKLYAHDRPADLGARLAAAGFTPEDPETLMVAEVAALATDTAPPAGVRLEAVTDAAGVDLVADVHEQAFGTSADRLRERLLGELAEGGDTRSMVVAMAGDLPVCAARMEFHPGTDFASLWGGGTVEAWRGRGVYRSIVAHRARVAAARGFRYLQVDASDQSRPILAGLGFEAVGVTTPYVRQG